MSNEWAHEIRARHLSAVKCVRLPILEMWHAPKDKGSLIILQSVFQEQVSLFLDIRNKVMFPSKSVSRELLERNYKILVND